MVFPCNKTIWKVKLISWKHLLLSVYIINFTFTYILRQKYDKIKFLVENMCRILVSFNNQQKVHVIRTNDLCWWLFLVELDGGYWSTLNPFSNKWPHSKPKTCIIQLKMWSCEIERFFPFSFVSDIFFSTASAGPELPNINIFNYI